MYRLSASLLALAPLVLSNPLFMAPRDDSRSCSDLSVKDFEWQVDDFDFHASYIFSTPAHQNSWGYASFILSNPAVPHVTASCSAASSQINDFFYGTQIYACTVNGTAGPAPASFAFNRPSGELDVNQTWTCRDKNPKYPTTFKAAGRVNLNLDCETSTWQNPNWTIGSIYSDTEIKCAPATAEVAPFLITAVA